MLSAPPAAAAQASPAATLTAHRILLRPSSGEFSASEQASLALGLLALPAELRDFPGAPIELERLEEAAPFGMGDGSAGRPLWSKDGRRFLLYRYQEPDDERARFRTGALSSTEREDLWRRRALVHAVVHRWEQAHRYGERLAWRVISGWPDRSAARVRSPLNTYEWAFSRELGRKSPSLDLLTFAEELFVPPGALRQGAVPVDDSLRCQELTRSRFLATVLGELGAQLPPRGPCPLLDAWTDPDDLERFEVLLAEPSAVHPESLFGHILLRPVRKKARPATLDEVFEIAAVLDESDGAAAFVLKGAMGGYVSTFGRTNMAQLRQRYSEVDQRSMRRFGLHLSASERLQVLERMWELERRGYLSYYFLSDNCASLLLFLLAPALGPELAEFRYPWSMPTVVLDELARRRRQVALADGSLLELPLLTPMPGRESSDIEFAFAADRTRPLTVRALRSQLDPESAALLQSFLGLSAAPAPQSRALAYQMLEELVVATLAKAPSPEEREAQRALWTRLLDEQLALERYAADRARRKVAGVDHARIIRERLRPPTAEDLLRFRKKLYRREDPSRSKQQLRHSIELEWLKSTAPRRPPTPREQRALDGAREVHQAFRQLAISSASLRASGTLSQSAPTPDPDTELWLREQARPRVRNSGHVRLSAAPVASWEEGLQARPGLQVRAALIAEHLGDQRDHGFGPRNEVRLLDGSAVLEWHGGKVEIPWADLVLVRFGTTTREPSLPRTGLWSRLGRGAGMQYRRRLRGLWRDALDANASVYLPLAGQDGSDGRLLALGLGATSQLRLALPTRSIGAGPRLEWLQRVPLGQRPGTALRLSGVYSAVFARGHRFEHQATAQGSVELPVRVLGKDLMVAPGAFVELEQRPGQRFLRGSLVLSLERL